MTIAYDDELGEYFCTVCDAPLEADDLIFGHFCAKYHFHFTKEQP